jgi:hypothetical protein
MLQFACNRSVWFPLASDKTTVNPSEARDLFDFTAAAKRVFAPGVGASAPTFRNGNFPGL